MFVLRSKKIKASTFILLDPGDDEYNNVKNSAL